MEIIIKGKPKEIAATILKLQERQNLDMDSIYEEIMSRFYETVHQGLEQSAVNTEQSFQP